jgi:hypothetical protein
VRRPHPYFPFLLAIAAACVLATLGIGARNVGELFAARASGGVADTRSVAAPTSASTSHVSAPPAVSLAAEDAAPDPEALVTATDADSERESSEEAKLLTSSAADTEPNPLSVADSVGSAKNVAASADPASPTSLGSADAADGAAGENLSLSADAPSTSDLQVATVDSGSLEHHVPDWLQVVVPSASLYGADTTSNQVLERLPRYTFLRVLAGGASRLDVQVFDENGSPVRSGWVDPNQVLPSAPGTDWLVSSTPTTLWSSASDDASAVIGLDAFTPLQRIDVPGGLDQPRIEVRVFRSDFSGVRVEGWVDAAATGLALPPEFRVPSPTDPVTGSHVAISTGEQQAFMSAVVPVARSLEATTGVPASVTVAQAILESNWGQSQLAQSANNYFGIKASGSLGNDGVVWMPTTEFDSSGRLYQTTSAFRAYKSLTDSLADHDQLLATAARYAAAMRATSDPRQFASLIASEGYSTDPSYADKLIALMDRYDLYQLDTY